MKVYVLLESTYGEVELDGVVTDLSKVHEPEKYYIHEVELDSEFFTRQGGLPQQKMQLII